MLRRNMGISAGTYRPHIEASTQKKAELGTRFREKITNSALSETL